MEGIPLAVAIAMIRERREVETHAGVVLRESLER